VIVENARDITAFSYKKINKVDAAKIAKLTLYDLLPIKF